MWIVIIKIRQFDDRFVFIIAMYMPRDMVFPLKWEPWARFNRDMSSYWYSKSYCGDKTILRPSYLHNEISILVRWHLYIESGPWSASIPAATLLQERQWAVSRQWAIFATAHLIFMLPLIRWGAPFTELICLFASGNRRTIGNKITE